MKYLAVGVAIGLAGCGAAQRPTSDSFVAAHEAAATAEQDCAAKLQSGALQTHVAVALCANPRVAARYRVARYPYMDLVYLRAAAVLAGAAAIDQGRASDDEVAAQFGELRNRLAAEERRRFAAAQPPLDAAGEAHAAAKLVAGLPVFATIADPALAAETPTAAVPEAPSPAPPPPEPAPAMAAAAPPPEGAAPPPREAAGFRLQFGVFQQRDNAEHLRRALDSTALPVTIEAAFSPAAGRTLYYVVSPVFPDRAAAQRAAETAALGAIDSVGFVIRPVDQPGGS
jgi:cell division septation protein DedD